MQRGMLMSTRYMYMRHSLMICFLFFVTCSYQNTLFTSISFVLSHYPFSHLPTPHLLTHSLTLSSTLSLSLSLSLPLSLFLFLSLSFSLSLSLSPLPPSQSLTHYIQPRVYEVESASNLVVNTIGNVTRLLV